MSKEQALAFRDFVTARDDVQDEIRAATTNGTLKVTELAAQHGFEFTAQEAQTAWDEVQANELSDFELEMVQGGAADCGGVCG